MKKERDERGAVVVELALVLPIVVIFIFGIVEFGRAYNAKIQLTSAVREGVRTAALGGPSVTSAAIADEVRAAATGLVGDDITVVLSSRCETTASVNTTVTARYPFRYDVPLVGSRTATLEATGVMRCAG